MNHLLRPRATFSVLAFALLHIGCNTNPAPPETRPEVMPPGSPASSQAVQSQNGTMTSKKENAQPVNVITIPARGAPRYLLVLLHGVGDHAVGFQGVGRELSPGLPEVEILIPDGFHPFDGGGEGRQWFSRVGITEKNRAERIQAAGTEVSSWIDGELRERGLSADRLAVGGFSQGAMVSGWLALHREPSPRAVVMLSGRLSEDPSWPVTQVSMPVFLGHGSDDSVIPVSFLAPAAKDLAARGARITERVYPGMAHQISRQELADVESFLRSALPASGSGK
jgi:phospholipase/carboxylesterase